MADTDRKVYEDYKARCAKMWGCKPASPEDYGKVTRTWNTTVNYAPKMNQYAGAERTAK